jgi:predicted Zn-dependent peptidase
VSRRPPARVEALPGGATVLLQPWPDAATAASAWGVTVGARDEPEAHAGVAHLLEHLAFKGDEELDAGGLARAFGAIGADANAYTAEDRTVYHATVLAEHAPALDRTLARLLRPALREEDVRLEREVVLEEIAADADDPDARLADLAAAHAHPGHPTGRPILGRATTVARLDRDALAAWRDAADAPGRRVVSLAGRIDPDAALERIGELVAAWPARDATPIPPRTPPPWRGGRTHVPDRRIRRVHGLVSAPGVAAADDDRYAAALVARVLGEPGVGALHWALVETGLAESAGLVHEAAVDHGRFVAWYETDPDRAERVTDVLHAVVRDATPEALDPEAWDRARTAWAADVALDAETPEGAMLAALDAWIERRAAFDLEAEVARIRATPLAAGRALLERAPFATWCHTVLAPAG